MTGTPVDLTNISNANNIGDLAIAVNQASGGVYGASILILIFFTQLAILMRYNTIPDSIQTALFSTTIIALILRTINMTNDYILGALIITTIGFYALKKIAGNQAQINYD